VIRRSPAESRTRLEQICPRFFERILAKYPLNSLGQLKADP